MTALPVFPKGGEVFPGGAVRFTGWLTGVPLGETATVTVELSTQGSSGPWSVLGEDLPNNGRLQWQIPSDVTSVNCYLRYTVQTATDSVVALTPEPFVINNGPRNVQIDMFPEDPPIVIPPEGGEFGFTAQVNNGEIGVQSLNGWIMVLLPSGYTYGPLLGPVTIQIQGGGQVSRDFIQSVPSGAPAGEYDYIALVGIYPYEIWDSGYFSFSKTGALR